MKRSPFSVDISPDWEGLVKCIKRDGMPERVHHIELFLDPEIQDEICGRFDLEEGLDRNDPFFARRRYIRLQRFLGYDYVSCGVADIELEMEWLQTEDTAGLARESGRSYINEHKGPITTWEEFERYPWPDLSSSTTRKLEWFNENLPDDMCIIGYGGFACPAEFLTWLMGYETLCYALFDNRELVQAIIDKLSEINEYVIERMLQFDRLKIVWGSDDMGFRTGTLISPDDLREFILPGHRMLAQHSHEAGRLYILHSCGELNAIYNDLIDEVKIDGKHSYEDVILPVTEAKERYGDRISILGGIDMDFLCRSSEQDIRKRVRDVLEKCMPGGGYCLGTGNTVANYIPVDNYLTMLDEGRKYKL